MTAMLPPTTPVREASAPSAETLGHLLWPAAATLVLHGAIISLLLGSWQSPSAPIAASEKVLKTQLVTISVAPAPEPIPAPLPPPVIDTPPPPPAPAPAPVVERPPEPIKPQIDHAAIARQRAAEAEQREQVRAEEQRQLAEQQRQKLEQEQRAQQQHAALAAAHAAQEAEARRSAEAASLSQYQPISKKPPAYPKRALDQRKEGDCTVEYTVTVQGKVHNPVVVEGACDDPVFARPALSSAKSFRYKPRMINGVAVEVPGVRNTFRFRLEQ